MVISVYTSGITSHRLHLRENLAIYLRFNETTKSDLIENSYFVLIMTHNIFKLHSLYRRFTKTCKLNS